MEIMAFHLIKYNLLLGVSLHSSVKTTCSLFITLFLSLPLTAERENVIYVCFAHGKLFRVPFNIEFIHTFQVKVTRVYFKSPRYKYKVLSHFMSFYGSSFRLSFSSSSFFFLLFHFSLSHTSNSFSTYEIHIEKENQVSRDTTWNGSYCCCFSPCHATVLLNRIWYPPARKIDWVEAGKKTHTVYNIHAYKYITFNTQYERYANSGIFRNKYKQHHHQWHAHATSLIYYHLSLLHRIWIRNELHANHEEP